VICTVLGHFDIFRLLPRGLISGSADLIIIAEFPKQMADPSFSACGVAAVTIRGGDIANPEAARTRQPIGVEMQRWPASRHRERTMKCASAGRTF